MKRKNTLIIPALLATAMMTFFPSCTKEEKIEEIIETVIPEEPSVKETIFHASYENHNGGDTKTYKDNLNIFWSAGDKISVWGTNNSDPPSGREFTLVDGAETASATFSSTNWREDNGYKWAFYPSTATALVILGGNTTSFVISPTQIYRQNSFGEGANYAIGYVNSGNDFNFKNICGLLRLNIKGTITVKKIAINTYNVFPNDNADVINGAAKVIYGSSYEYPCLVMTKEDYSNHITTLDCSADGGVQLKHDTPTSFFIVLPPGSLSHGFDVIVTDMYNKDYTKRASSNDNNTIERSKITNMPEFEIVTKIPSGSMANCIILPTEGKYELNLSHKGGSTANADIITPSSVEIKWSDSHLSFTPIEYNLETKWVNFTYSNSDASKSGNALLVAKDGSNNILWSWHLWCTNGVPQTVGPYHDGSTPPEEKGYFMDRNLGATGTSGADSHGLFYQWGRKDPLSASSSSVAIADAGASPLAYSIQNPNTFINGNTTSYDWYASTTEGKNDYLWSKVNGESSGIDGKSIYDPCPYGWQLPAGDCFANFYNGDTPNASGDFANGYDFYYQGASGGTHTWYPAAGYLFYSTGLISNNTVGYYWSKSSDALVFCEGSATVDPNGGLYRANGFNVRCMKPPID